MSKFLISVQLFLKDFLEHLLLLNFGQKMFFFFPDNRVSSDGSLMEFKSKQWFGASVRSDGEHILVRKVAPKKKIKQRILLLHRTFIYVRRAAGIVKWFSI